MLFFNKGKQSNKLTTRRSLKMAVISALAASVFTFSSPASAADTAKFTTVYHVYLNGTFIGTVSNKDVVEKMMNEKVQTLKESFKDKDLNIGVQVDYIREQVFRSTANNQETVRNLENAIQLQVEASAISIDGTPIVYLDSKETSDEVIKKLKLQFVTEEQLIELEARKTAGTTELTPLKENETRLLDVRMSKEVSVLTEKVSPDKIMSSDDALNLLLKGTLEEKKYIVQEGDVLGTIANGHGLTLAEFLALNPGLTEETVVNIGEEVNVTALKPYVEVIVDKEVNQKESMAFVNEVVEDASMPKGETNVKQEGQDGERSVNYLISEQNGITLKKDVTSEQVIKQPVNHIVVKGTKVIPSRGTGTLAWPVSGGYISSQQGQRWGKQHKGIDIARPSNRTIKAADNGKVVSAGYDGGYGNKIVIDHQNGLRTVYAHLESIGVSVGQTVSQGSAIGVMGTTGNSTGIHLHFEVYKNGALENPLNYVSR
jgi:murein DD-endopeptidase MepM/ murein hydrolase activator NlpD